MPRSANPKSSRCSHCRKRFRDATKMSQHIRRAHPSEGKRGGSVSRDDDFHPEPFQSFSLTGDNNRITTRSTNV